MRRQLFVGLILACGVTTPAVSAGRPATANRITILYDAFGHPGKLTPDWGFSALIEYDGRRGLFDAGNNSDIWARNVKQLGVDLRRLDFVVISHRHGDHTSGLNALLRVNPGVTIYVPRENYGAFGGSLPGTFYRRDESLPEEMRYFGGTPPETIRHGTPWTQAHFVYIDSLTEIVPGVSVVPTVSRVPGTLELRELSLSVRTPEGQVLVVGCSHAGIEQIVAAAALLDSRVALIAGGLHLVNAPDAEVERVARALHDEHHVVWIAPGHCTGEPAFQALRRIYGDHYVYAGLGTAIPLPAPSP